MVLSLVSFLLVLIGIFTFVGILENPKFKSLRIFQILPTIGPLSLVTTPEFGSFSLPVPLLYPLSSLPSHLTRSALLSLVSLSEFSLFPSKIQGFLWKIAWLPKEFNQFFYLYLTLLTNAYPLCLSAKESNNHLFLHCHFCWRLWDKVFKLLNLNWMICDKMPSFIFSWRLSLSEKTPTTV